MAAIFFERYVGKDAKVNDPSTILFSATPDLLGRGNFEEKKKLGLLDLATQLKLKHRISPPSRGSASWRTKRSARFGRICHSIVLESYACPDSSTLVPTHTRRM